VRDTSCAYRFLDENPEGKRLLGRPRYRWKDNIKLLLKIIIGGLD
jgi:hypothetical protein